MLVLTRKLKERIRVGDDIVITVVKLESGRVRIGIEAPDDIKIIRDEIAGTPPRKSDKNGGC